MAIVTRADKGSELTFDEMDNNFTENDTVDIIDKDYILKVPIDVSGSYPTTQGAITVQKFETDSVLYGNKRGDGAVDLQCYRSNATQVASGTGSVAIGGNNTVSGNYSVGMGNGNTISSNYSVGIGNSNVITNDYSIAMGFNNTSSGFTSVAMGFNNTSSREFSTAFGYGNTASNVGSFVMGYTTKNIQPMSSMIGLGSNEDYTDIISSTNEYADTVKTIDNAATDTQNPIMLKLKSVVYAKLRLIAVSNSMDKWIADVTHTITTQADGTVSVTTIKTDIVKDVADWDISFTAVNDTNNPKLKCTVTGVADVTIGWGLSGSISETFNYHVGS